MLSGAGGVEQEKTKGSTFTFAQLTLITPPPPSSGPGGPKIVREDRVLTEARIP